MTTFPTTSMKIALVGAGNLATHLALSLVKAGHHVVGICSKTGETARSLSLRRVWPHLDLMSFQRLMYT